MYSNSVASIMSKNVGNSLSNLKTWGNVSYQADAYGIVGDGVTDVTGKLQALVNLAISEGRKLIMFPHGTYYVTSLTNADQVYFIGDNASFTGGYSGTIDQFGGYSAQLADIAVNVKSFGAIGDGESHPLSEAFATLIQAQVVYPDAVALTDEIDWCAIQKAANAVTIGKAIRFPAGRYMLTRDVAYPQDEYGDLLIDTLMDAGTTFSGPGKMPHIVTNIGHPINGNYYAIVGNEGNYAAVPITAEAISKGTFEGVAVGGLFAARGIDGIGQVWGLNTITKLEPMYLDDNANGIGYECDLDCYARDGQGQGILITGIGDKSPEVGLVVERAGGPSWQQGIRVKNAKGGIYVNLIGEANPEFGMLIEGMPNTLIKLHPSTDTNPNDPAMFMTNADSSTVNYNLRKNGIVYQQGLQVGREDSTITRIYKFSSPVTDLTSIAAHSSVEYDVSVPSEFTAGDTVSLSSSSIPNGLMWNGYMLAAGNLRIRIANITASAIDPPAHQFVVTLISSQ